MSVICVLNTAVTSMSKSCSKGPLLSKVHLNMTKRTRCIVVISVP